MKYKIIPFLILFSFGVYASDYPELPDDRISAYGNSSLTLKELYNLALNNFRIKAGEEKLFQAEKNKAQVGSSRWPHLNLDIQYLRRPDSVGSSGNSVLRAREEERLQLALRQIIYSGGRNRALLKIAEKEIDLAGEDLSLVKEEIIYKTTEEYYFILKAKKNVFLRESEVKRLEENRRQAEKRFEVGEVSKNVLLRAEAELSGARADLIRSKNSLRIAKERLAVLTGVENLYDVAESKPLKISQSLMEKQLIAEALINRRELKKAQITKNILREEQNVSRSWFYPSLNFEGLYTNSGQNPATPFWVKNEFSGALILSFPLYEGGQRRAESVRVSSKLREAEFNTESIKDNIILEIKTAIRELIYLNSTIDNLKDQVKFAKENQEIVSNQFNAGLVTILEVMDANSLLMEAETGYVSSLYDRELAAVRLKRAQGILMKEADWLLENQLNEK